MSMSSRKNSSHELLMDKGTNEKQNKKEAQNMALVKGLTSGLKRGFSLSPKSEFYLEWILCLKALSGKRKRD